MLWLFGQLHKNILQKYWFKFSSINFPIPNGSSFLKPFCMLWNGSIHSQLQLRLPASQLLEVNSGSLFTTCKRNLGQGNVFTPVCQSFCSRGVSPWTDTIPSQTPTPPRQTPPRQTPPRWADTPAPTDSNWSRWYASYWNAFLFKQVNYRNHSSTQIPENQFFASLCLPQSFLNYILFEIIEHFRLNSSWWRYTTNFITKCCGTMNLYVNDWILEITRPLYGCLYILNKRPNLLPLNTLMYHRQ